MKFTAPVQSIQDAYESISMSVDKDAEAITSHVLIAVGESVVISANNGLSFSTGIIEGNAASEGQATIEGDRLRKCLAALEPGDVVTISSDASKGARSVTVETPYGKQRFQSLDPVDFLDFSKQIDGSKTLCEVPAATLETAIGHCKNFVYANENEKPELARIESQKGGALVAFDTAHMAVYRLAELSEVDMGEDKIVLLGRFADAVIKFLHSLPQGSKVNVLKSASGSSLMFSCGSRCMGVSMPSGKSSNGVPDVLGTQVDYARVVKRSDIDRALNILLAGAPKVTPPVTFRQDGSRLLLAMPNASGNVSEIPVAILNSTSTEGADESHLTGGISVVSVAKFRKILSLLSGEDVNLGFKTPRNSTATKSLIYITESRGKDLAAFLLTTKMV